ncbi:tetratricopeptide repeat protein [Catenovulum agarivorans]|uniref:tetratricopeptide repeat protein n=1 Tax=Catenovulum agarivorans TaxID=1172192 RepID=UPI0002D45325|nr:sel1 repeat family protein [Catenovulum agarivorans]
MAKFIQFLLVSLIFTATGSQASVLKGSVYFAEKNYTKAYEEYSRSAQLGNAHAYYQLAVMAYNGLGQAANEGQAAVWFYLAAEQNFQDAEKMYQDILAMFDPKQQKIIQQQAAHYQKIFGQKSIKQKYYPTITPERLTTQIVVTQSLTADDENAFADEFDEVLADIEFDMEDSDGVGFNWNKMNQQRLNAAAKSDKLMNAPYLALVDYYLATDGSLRDLMPFNQLGRIDRAMGALKSTLLEPATYVESPVNFIQRASLGVARYDSFKMMDKFPRLYTKIKRQAAKLRKDKSADGQFELAMMLANFSWVKKHPTEEIDILTDLANQHMVAAQYELGLALYRQQIDVEQGINWLFTAAQYGHEKAAFHLAQIIQFSPWVTHDTHKAYLWYQQSESLIPAQLKLTEINLTAKDKNLNNFKLAKTRLNKLKKLANKDPDYEFLSALYFKNKPSRNLPLALKHMRTAIRLADSYNWDSSAWQDMLADWTQGRVTITKEGEVSQ